jgi:DNA-directed RNA polymerase specialized sigma24 family protein
MAPLRSIAVIRRSLGDRCGADLTPRDLAALLARLAPDCEQAGASYEEIRRRLVWLFEPQLGDASEELADEAIDRVARRLAQGMAIHAEKPFAYFRGVARNVAQEMLRERRRERRAFTAAFGRREPEPDADPRLACLQSCLDRLPAGQRRLILVYHEGSDRYSRQCLAHELGIRVNALRIRAHRVRRRLEDCCARCLQTMEEK